MGMEEFDKEGLARRARAFRELHGKSQTEWAELTGIPYKKWNHYERGYPLSREALFQLYKVIKAYGLFKLSSDWLYWGDYAALTGAEQRQLEEQIAKVLLRQQKKAKRLAPSKPLRTTEVRKRISRRDRKRKASHTPSNSASPSSSRR